MEKCANHTRCNRTCGTMMRGYREPLVYSSMSRVAGQSGKIATRTVQVVAGTLTPSRTASVRFGRNRLVGNGQNKLGGTGLGARIAVSLVKESNP